DDAPDREGARLRLRSALRRLVDQVWVLVVPRGVVRLAAVQLHFREGGRRQYLLYSRPLQAPGGRRIEAAADGRSFAAAGAPGSLDLRDPDHVRRLEAWLLRLDLSAPSEQ